MKGFRRFQGQEFRVVGLHCDTHTLNTEKLKLSVVATAIIGILVIRSCSTTLPTMFGIIS